MIQRILLCSLAVPTPAMPHFARWNIEQAAALGQLGVHTELFRPVFRFPLWLSHMSSRARRHVARPEQYEIAGITIRCPRVYFAAPWVLRVRLTAMAPGVVTRLMQVTVARALRRQIEQFRPDALIVHSVIPWGRLVRQEARQRGIPYAFIEHSPDEVIRIHPGSALARHYRTLSRDARAVFVVGEQMRRHLVEQVGCSNVLRINNGITPPTEAQRLRPRPPEWDGRFVILCSGAYYRKRAFEELVEGFAAIAARHPHATLLLVTNPPETLTRRIAELNLDGRIQVRAPVPHEELLQLMVWSDLFAMPAWQESFGIVYGEALAAGTPVVMSSDCGFAHVIGLPTPGQDRTPYGWTIAPRSVDAVAAALDAALSTPAEERRAMGAAGRTLVLERLTWRQNAQAVLDALQR